MGKVLLAEMEEIGRSRGMEKAMLTCIASKFAVSMENVEEGLLMRQRTKQLWASMPM